jgi:hypothetical protein
VFLFNLVARLRRGDDIPILPSPPQETCSARSVFFVFWSRVSAGEMIFESRPPRHKKRVPQGARFLFYHKEIQLPREARYQYNEYAHSKSTF